MTARRNTRKANMFRVALNMAKGTATRMSDLISGGASGL